MSAYVCDRDHVLYLVMAWSEIEQKHGKTYGCEELAGMADMLMRQNVESVRARYPNAAPDELPGPCDAKQYLLPFDPLEMVDRWGGDFQAVQVFKAADCYEYQSCESDGWEDTDAVKLVRQIADHYKSKIPGYAAAKWGAPEPSNAVRLF